MKKQFLFSLIVILPLIYSCNNRANDTNNISIAVSDMSKDSLISLKNGFINKYPNINIEIKEFKDASTINYLLNHNKLDCDLVAFEEFNDSIIYSSKLALLNRYEGINELSNDMLTHIKDNKGNIYSLPSVGKLYCNILNLDLFSQYDIYGLAEAKRADIEKIIRSCGSYTKKSKYIIEIAKRLVENYNAYI